MHGQTPTLILERRKGSRNSEAKPQFGHRDGVIPCDRCCNPWVSCLLLPPPIQQQTRPRYPQRYTEGETLLREYLGPSTATKVESKCCVETITAGPGRGAPTQARKGAGRPGGFWPSDGGTLSTHSTHSTLTTRASISTYTGEIRPRTLFFTIKISLV